MTTARPAAGHLLCVGITAPGWVRSADLGAAVVVLDTRTGQVRALTEPARQIWLALARHGHNAPAAAQSDLDPDQIAELVNAFTRDGLLHTTRIPAPWPVPATRSRPSWGINTLPVRLRPPAPRTVGHRVLAALAVLALGITCAVREVGPRDRAFGRLLRLAARATSRAWRSATDAEAEAAVYAVRAVSRWWPARTACLEESISAALLLGLLGRRVSWCHGAAPDPVQLHAWIETDQPVAEPQTTRLHIPLLRIPQTPPRQRHAKRRHAKQRCAKRRCADPQRSRRRHRRQQHPYQ
jgi:Transglutaminase-like superfamily